MSGPGLGHGITDKGTLQTTPPRKTTDEQQVRQTPRLPPTVRAVPVETPREQPELARPVSRRKVLIGLGLGGAVAATGIGWWVFSHGPVIPEGTTVYKGHSSFVNSVAWSPDGKYIASGSGDRTVQVWEAATGNRIIDYTGHSGFVTSVAWSPAGKYIVSGDGLHTVQVWEALTGNTILVYKGQLYGVNSVAWSPDSTKVVSGSGDAQVWVALTGNKVLTYTGYTGGMVSSVVWSPDGKYIASGDTGSNDTTVQVWDAATGSIKLVYKGHSKFVNSVAWSPDGKHIASGSDDQTVQVWVAP